MRTILILLLSCVCVGANLFGFGLKEKSTGPLGTEVKGYWENVWEKMKQHFDTTTLFVFRKKLETLKNEIKAQLALSKEKLAEVAERLELVKRTKVNEVQRLGDNVMDINLNVGVGQVLFQGDIVPTKEQANDIVKNIRDEGSRSKRQAFRDRNYPRTTWPDRRVPYLFHRSTSQSARRVFRKAAKLWQENTCIDIFEVKQATEAIRVVRKEGCWSSVGKTRGLQDLSLGKNCDTVGSAAHELGHALGFHHTQARFDRDKSIYVLSQNIKPNWFDQFTRETPATNYNYDLPYDYGSIMQYGATSATRNMRAKSPTMVPKDQRYLETLGSPFISFIDILMMNLHYNCTAKCNVRTAARCANYGFPHPRDCSRCICPGGYGGRLCDKKPGTCGKILRATSKQKVFTDVVGNKRAGGHPREDFSFCHYWIKAPAGKRVKVQLVRFTPRRIAVDGCKYGGVEFKAQKDQRLTGIRYCSPQDEGTVLISESNLMPIITYNRIYASTITIRYSFV